ncbi:MAG: glycosyltransferase family 9 protein [Synechococcales cyanobacterium C42_A2020_086]|nr:glycosyltransferase family 9 protein [Synechococcales cyanobacterium C42_A2020_086]
MPNLHSILFIELLGGMGDLVIALPAMHALARSHPTAQFTVLTFAPAATLLQSDPWVDRVLIAEPGAARAAVERALQQPFDLVVSDTNYDGIADLIQQSSAPYTVTNLWRSPPPHQRVSDRFIELLTQDGWIAADAVPSSQPFIHLTASERATARTVLGATYRPLVVLCPEAGMVIKRWSPDRWIHLGRALQSQGASLLIPVGAEADLADAIAQGIGGSTPLWPRGSLRSLAAVMAVADLVIAADTGLAQIAAALQVPTLTLFGPSWHERYGQPAPHINLQGFPDCPERRIHNFTEQCCWYSGSCPFEWQTCLDDLSPERVLEAALTLLHPLPHCHSSVIESVREFSATALSPEWQAVRKLLVMRLDNIGDVIMTSPVLRALRQSLPEAEITLMASPAGSQVAPLFPWIDQVLPWRVLWQDLGKLDFDPSRELHLIETLRSQQFDAAIILTSFSQSPHPAALVCALAGIPLRLGESKETDAATLTHAVPPAAETLHQVERNLRLIEWVGFPVPNRRLALQIPPKACASLQSRLPGGPYLLLTPWTSCPSRNYPLDRFAVAARQLSGFTGWPVVVAGMAKDRAAATSLLQQLGDCAIDLIGNTSLPEFAALVAAAQLVLTNNTSTMHIADAFNVPMVILFAGTEYECQWQPRHAPNRLLRRSTVCSPCYAFTCAYNLQCLDIAPERVVSAAQDLLTQAESIVGQSSFEPIRL